ncbi:hypothetical protein [Vacuolonema iberomarrocanum]|uniref:hypothetical protein n=1 Tax=Vacuolonema iberomarrocanum TaxID=3454632 RepID=UPI0019FAB953|nr:hypothetical protein [filamentous cyanobacterium LEGE 07170]
MAKTHFFVLLWRYMNQPLFSRQSPATLNPQRFWYTYRVKYLERCWCQNFLPEEHFRNRG